MAIQWIYWHQNISMLLFIRKQWNKPTFYKKNLVCTTVKQSKTAKATQNFIISINLLTEDTTNPLVSVNTAANKFPKLNTSNDIDRHCEQLVIKTVQFRQVLCKSTVKKDSVLWNVHHNVYYGKQ